ncbi:hypothetical protein GW17_00020179 [Ensete ventricosum]|nr:hypothetical protein GW17_00020179 [Ensete ventricosum]
MVWYPIPSNEASPRLAGERRLIPVRGDEASPHSPTGRRCDASFSRWKMRRRFIASFSCGKMRCHLVPAQGDALY